LVLPRVAAIPSTGGALVVGPPSADTDPPCNGDTPLPRGGSGNGAPGLKPSRGPVTASVSYPSPGAEFLDSML
jgi:hypothetical protein